MSLTRKLCLGVFLVGMPSLATAELLYSHDDAGNALSGSLDALITAVKKGEGISISYTSSDILWVRTCSSVSLFGGVVSCYITDVIDTTSGGGARTFDTPRALEAHIYDTSGYRAAIKRDFFTGSELAVDPSETQQAFGWHTN